MLNTALAQTRELLSASPTLAAEQAREILQAVPKHPEAELLLGIALRLSGDLKGARAVLLPLAQSQISPAVHYELGLVLGALGESANAIKALAYAAKLNPRHAGAWRALGDEKTLAGDNAGADIAYAESIKASVNEPKLMEAAAALAGNKLAVSERILRPYLKEHPTDVAAIRMLAEIGARLERYDEAEKLLARCLELAPSFSAARHNYASILLRENRPRAALVEADRLLASEPRNPGYRALKAATLSQLGEFQQASQAYQSLLNEFPNQPRGWMSYGHTLKTLGKVKKGIDAYRRAIAQLPSLGEAYWSLANLKTFRFTPDDIVAMRAQLDRDTLKDEDRFHFEFALGKALEDGGHHADSLEHYKKANALRRRSLPYHAGQTTAFAHRLATIFTRSFFEKRADAGSQHRDPIFIVGMPRSGSTLIEQILSSHSQVEGTMELHDVGQISRELGQWTKREGVASYPEVLEQIPLEQFAAFGEKYVQRTRVHRKLGRPFFIDKMPNNFLHVGLIHLMLPGAKIIDARRHPLACCFSCFKQHFARGQAFSYELEDVGQYYADYVRLMAHYDVVLPGRVHRVIYEQMVSDSESSIKALLEYCGLPFEESCLRFYENDRAVRTASSEQVRQPIFADGIDHWRNFESGLSPLKDALGDVLTLYPATPEYKKSNIPAI